MNCGKRILRKSGSCQQKSEASRGTLASGSGKLLDFLNASNDMLSLNDKVFAYARMSRDEDNANSKYQALNR